MRVLSAQGPDDDMQIFFDRHIGISPQFSVHVIDERQVLLLSERRSFRLIGKLYVALLPHLDGTHTGTQIVQAFAGRVTKEQVESALRTLVQKSYATYCDAEAPSSRQALWSEWGLTPAKAEADLRRCAVSVKAISRDAASSEAARQLRRAAAACGLRVVRDNEADLAIVSVQDYLHRELAATNLVMRKSGRPWILFKAGGGVPLIGPVLHPGSAPCWACLTNRMLENRPGDRLVGSDIKAVRPALAYTGATLALAANFAALELARSIVTQRMADFDRKIVSLDLSRHARREHEIRLDPNCAVCGEPHDRNATLERAMRPLELRSQPVLPQADGGWRVSTAADVVKRLERYVSPITGIIDDVEDTSPQDGLPVFQAKQANPTHTSPRENRFVGRPGAAAGKGMEKTQARASCLAEAIERYSCGFTGREPRLRSPWHALGKAAPHPHSYLNYSERQYDARDTLNTVHSGFNWIGERFDESREIEWTPAWSLTHGERRWLPTRYCYFNYADDEVPDESEVNKFCMADSNGCASGSTIEEAILQGFLELVERDACALWWYNKVQRPAFDLGAEQGAFIRRVSDFCASRDRGLHVLDLTNDIGIPVAIAVSYSRSNGRSIALGLGAHFDASIAISRALAEMNQMVTLEIEMARSAVEFKITADNRAMHDWTNNKSLETEGYCVPEGTIRADAYRRPQIGNLKDAVDLATRVVSDRGFDMIVLDHSRREIDFAAARVVVPGMRHFWARYREGRLYDTPVELGWLESPLGEDGLNTTPFFL